MRVDEVMKRDIWTCREDTPVRDCARLMRDHDIGFLPVLDARGRAIGAITDRDLCCRILADGLAPETPVGRCMSRDVVACRPEHDLLRCEQMMANAQKSRVMVLDDDGCCVGVVSLSDVGHYEEITRAGQVFCAVTDREAHA